MDEFGSPIAGGIRAVRRSVSSGVFRPIQRPEAAQAQPDSITTNLLSQNSLTLTSISSQLQNVSAQVASLNTSLTGIKENLALNDSLERQREAAKQNRERILAEQGLREGKESALERKIQNALTYPLRRLGGKARGILARLVDFFFILAGGWLTSTGIDLLKALSDGNTDKIRELQSRFTKGLLVIGGIFTALQVGIGVTINLLARFVGTVARVAFGGLLKASLGGVKRLLSAVVGQIAGTAIGRTVGAGLRSIGGTLGISGGVNILDRFLRSLRMKRNPSTAPSTAQPNVSQQLIGPKGTRQLVIESADDALLPPSTAPKAKGFFGRSVDKVKNIFKPAAKTTAKTATKTVAKEGAKRGIMSFLKKGAGKLLGKIGGPFLTFIFNLASGEGIGGALAAAAGFAAGAKIGASIGAAIGAFFGGIGAIPGAFIGGLIGGLIGETAMKGLFRGIQSLFGLGKKSASKPEDLPELTFDDFKSKDDQADNINPVENENDKIASNISDVNEGQPSIINIPLNTPPPSIPQVSMGKSPSESKQIPTIAFDTNNPHTLYATATYGV